MYYLVYGLLYLISLLPLWMLFGLSDGLAFLLYTVIRYRRQVVWDDLLHAFPEKSDAERLQIAKRFYRNFTDNFIESIKLLSASRRWVRKHFVIDNPGLLDYYFVQGRKLQVHLGHCFNWELGNAVMPMDTRYPCLVAYMPVENKTFERLFLKLRSRTGTILLPATRMSKAMIPYRNQPYMLVLVADQAPGGPENTYWMNFFGQPTAFIRGPERGARIADIPVIFARFYKLRRGYYHAELITIEEHPGTLPEGELTRRYGAMLEDAIRRQPDCWLWSHRRWKIAWKDELRSFWIDKDAPGVTIQNKAFRSPHK